jgi:hypothetical protein
MDERSVNPQPVEVTISVAGDPLFAVALSKMLPSDRDRILRDLYAEVLPGGAKAAHARRHRRPGGRVVKGSEVTRNEVKLLLTATGRLTVWATT